MDIVFCMLRHTGKSVKLNADIKRVRCVFLCGLFAENKCFSNAINQESIDHKSLMYRQAFRGKDPI